MVHRTTSMICRVLPRHTTVAAYLALLLASSTAVYAAATIGSPEAINNSLQSVDLKDGAAVGGVDVINDSLTGTDVKESTLKGSPRKIIWTLAAETPAPRQLLTTVGAFTLKASCLAVIQPPVTVPYVTIFVRGPVGDAQVTGVSSRNDIDDNILSGASFLRRAPTKV